MARCIRSELRNRNLIAMKPEPKPQPRSFEEAMAQAEASGGCVKDSPAVPEAWKGAKPQPVFLSKLRFIKPPSEPAAADE
jgi:hypothetical protein